MICWSAFLSRFRAAIIFDKSVLLNSRFLALYLMSQCTSIFDLGFICFSVFKRSQDKGEEGLQ